MGRIQRSLAASRVVMLLTMLVVGGRGVKDAASLDSAGFEASVQLHDDDVVSLSLGESS